MSVAAIFQLDTPFTEAELPYLHYEQTADLFVITNMNHAIKRLRRFGHSNWILDDAPIGPQITAPTGVGGVVVNPQAGSADYIGTNKGYAVTAVNAAGQESQPSTPVVNLTNDLTLRGDHNIISWTTHPEAVEYRIYEMRSGIYGYLGTSRNTAAFVDDNIQANFADGPPRGDNPFSGGNNPATVTFHESRTFLGRSLTAPNALWAGQTDDLFNFDKSSPLRATDAMAFRLRARRLNTIRHLSPMKDLVVWTSDMIFTIRATGEGYLSPTTAKAMPESHRGVGSARPALVGDIAFYTSVAENSIHTLGFTFEKDGYRGNDVTVFASHFLANNTAMEMVWCDMPDNILWVRRDDGKLLALTWMQEQDVWGWTLCETDGVVESICSVAEGRRDTLYAVIRRTVDGEQKRYVEYMAEAPWVRQGWNDQPSSVVLDCSVTLSSETEFQTITRMDWLEGRSVVCLADGVVIRDRSVVDGVLTPALPNPVKLLTVGLPYVAHLRTLPQVAPVQGKGSLVGVPQEIANTTLTVLNTGGMGAGLLVGANLKPDEVPHYAIPLPDVLTATPQALFSGLLATDGVEAGDWTDPCVTIMQTDPLPLVVMGVHSDPVVGG